MTARGFDMPLPIRSGAVLLAIVLPAIALLLSGCGGGGGSTGAASAPAGTDVPTASCTGDCVEPGSALTVADVETLIARGVAEANARGATATIAVVDRVGNVLAVWRMGPNPVLIATATDAGGAPLIGAGLEGIALPSADVPLQLDDQAAITKAITAAYLSTEGNAFTTRTASQIVQRHFNPGEENQPGGPLFGVQFSQLACSDFTLAAADGDAGPKRSPLGLAADPGGLPLYRNGVPIGGVGVIADGRYGLDPTIIDTDSDLDELIATAASYDLAAPVTRRADRITVEGKTLRFSDAGFGDLWTDPASAPPFASLTVADGSLVAVNGYSDGTIRAGTTFGTAASGIRADADGLWPQRDAFVFVDASDAERFAPRAGTDGLLTRPEVIAILDEALAVAERARAQIRQPLGDHARVTIAVVDTSGAILGMVRTLDAPVFGADVSLQKARTATFFSSATAADHLNALPPARYVTTFDGLDVASVDLAGYVTAVRDFLGDPTALATGQIAFSDRAGGNLSRPDYPDGLLAGPPGPLSKPAGEWSPFSTGLQLDISINAILQHVLATAGLGLPDVGSGCGGVALAADLSGATPAADIRIGNGLQIFPGSVPIYRDGTLVGGIGVSGDGVDQDDMIAFLAVHNAGERLGTVNNAPIDRRADTLTPNGVRLRYIQCPQAPFLDNDEDDVCAGL